MTRSLAHRLARATLHPGNVGVGLYGCPCCSYRTRRQGDWRTHVLAHGAELTAEIAVQYLSARDYDREAQTRGWPDGAELAASMSGDE
jgi:hypothetical protein